MPWKLNKLTVKIITTKIAHITYKMFYDQIWQIAFDATYDFLLNLVYKQSTIHPLTNMIQ